MITVETIKTQNGYYGRVVAEGDTVMYSTTVYFTQYMAMADANCWEKFHMTGEHTHTTCSTCGVVKENEGPWNLSVVWCDDCVKAGKHLPAPKVVEFTIGDKVTVHNMTAVREGAVGIVDTLDYPRPDFVTVKLDEPSDFGRKYVTAERVNFQPTNVETK